MSFINRTPKFLQAVRLRSLLQSKKFGRQEPGNMVVGHPRGLGWLTTTITLAEAQGANIVGLTGSRKGVGVTVVSHQLAAALAHFGKRTLLVDASRADFTMSGDGNSSKLEATISDFITDTSSNPALVDLALGSDHAVDDLRYVFQTAAQRGFVVVVDLPSVVDGSGVLTPAFATAAPACDLIFLVCLSGTLRRRELRNCVDTCTVLGAKLGGLILNDWKLPASGLLEG